MKKLLPLLSILIIAVIVIAACNSKPQTDANNGKVLTYTDTTGLADFQKWKTQNELKDPTVYYSQGNEVGTSQPVKKATTRKISPTYRSASKNGAMNSVAQYPAKTSAKKKAGAEERRVQQSVAVVVPFSER